jgi:diguanylate cyclase (GGDEF)-like protein/PAS domain S-box-containing protein
LPEDSDLRQLLDLAPTAVMLLQRSDGSRPGPTVRMVNRAFTEVTGLAAEALSGRSMRALAALVEDDGSFAGLLTAAQTGEPYRSVLRLRDGQGQVVAAAATGHAMADRADHYAIWLQPSSVPAAPQQRPADPLRLLSGLSSECFYELAVDVDCGLRLTWADPRIADLTGYAPEELVTMGGFFGLVAAVDLPELQRRNQRLLVNQPGPIRYRLRRKTGELRHVRDHGRAERAPGTDLVCRVVGTLADVTDSGWAAIRPEALEREAALLDETLGASVLVLDLQGRILWVADRPVEPMAARLRGQVGQSLGSVLPSRLLDRWLDWLGEGAAARHPLRCRLGWPEEDGELALEAVLTSLGEGLVQVVAWPSQSVRGPVRDSTPGGRTLLEALREPLLLVGEDRRIREVNSAFERLVGHARTDLVGAPVIDRLGTPATRTRLDAALGAVIEGGERETGLSLVCVLRGGERELQLRLRALAAGPDAVEAVLIEVHRLDEKAPAAVSNGEGWLAAVMKNVADGIVLLDADGIITWLSHAAESIFDYPRDAAIGGPIDLLLPPGEEFGPGLLERLRQAPPRQPLELTVRRRSGDLTPIEVEVSFAEQRERRMIVLVVRDLTGRQQTEETLRSLAYHDSLTGLPNRLLFDDRLTQAIERARRARQLLTVMLIDLDRFTLINDSLGLGTGDQIIKGVAERLVGALRRSDTVARLGGDEFMVLLLGTSGAEAAARVAQKLIEVLRPPLQVEGHELTTSASIGIALFPHDGDDPDTLLKNAANALSRAKEQGRNHYQFYTDDMNATAFERLMLESRLRKALEQQEFVIHYQPKVSLLDGSILGVEALLRWYHPDLGMVPPAEFIPLAEETGLIVPIGAWVLCTACAQVGRWQRMGHKHLDLAVNISARQFQEKNLVATIAAAVADSGLPATRIELELTESVIMRDAPDAARRLKELTALGIRLAIDDFGTGYSSLGYLRTFPIHSLKIDRSFVRDIDRDPNSAALAKAIIAMAAGLRLKVVAEGVETREQLARLREFGCQELQGYLFSKPLPADELLPLLEQGRRLEL